MIYHILDIEIPSVAVPDETVDERQSIYSIGASKERRVEIIDVNTAGLSDASN